MAAPGEAVAMGDAENVVSQYLAAMTEQSAAPASRREVTAADTIPNIDHRFGRVREPKCLALQS